LNCAEKRVTIEEANKYREEVELAQARKKSGAKEPLKLTKITIFFIKNDFFQLFLLTS